MPLFTVICRDRPGALEIRKATRDAHLAYLGQGDAVQQAGPFLDSQGQMCGSLLVLDLPDLDAAKTWAAGDPYAAAGLFDSVTIDEWKRVIG
ncbi:MAG: YciI family protein [Mangrovicoccus sp.]|nr:YciI family protein [Mangrovicoccus sp.]